MQRNLGLTKYIKDIFNMSVKKFSNSKSRATLCNMLKKKHKIT